MLSLQQVLEQYPDNLRPFGRFVLREYLQHKLLQLIYDSEFANRFQFLGGTCLRIVHGNSRFSEDLDFDNSGVTETDFGALSRVVQRGLEAEGY
ncbi:MAG: nucleotidyl transferase AbiEii/AbiGii toxin family protein, partial [Cytophagaceae bacterium]